VLAGDLQFGEVKEVMDKIFIKHSLKECLPDEVTRIRANGNNTRSDHVICTDNIKVVDSSGNKYVNSMNENNYEVFIEKYQDDINTTSYNYYRIIIVLDEPDPIGLYMIYDKYEKNKDGIEYSGPEEMNMEFLNVKNKIYIPTADNNGNTSWGELTAVTRHDPGDILYKIVTYGGKEVIIPNSKTLLIWNGKEFNGKKTSEVKIGDYVPSTINLPEPPVIKTNVDMSKYFPKNKYIYGT
jgi:hypothetical protein